MKKEQDAAQPLHGYLLPEDQHQQLRNICDNLRMMADFVIAITEEEESEPLQIPRSRLGWLFECYSLQLEHVLDNAQWIRHKAQVTARKY
jgi:hypothetical protein